MDFGSSTYFYGIPCKPFINSICCQKRTRSKGKEYKKERREAPELRTEKSETYINPDGTYTSKVYERPIHFKDKSGKWARIDNTLVPDETDSHVVNKANKFKVKFPKKNSGTDLVEVSEEDTSISMAPVTEQTEMDNRFMKKQASVQAKVEKNKIIYPEIYPNADFRYFVGNQQIKEDIILKEKPSADTPTQFSFQLNIKGLTYKQETDGRVLFFNKKTKEPVFYLDKPFMYDANIPEGYKANPELGIEPQGVRSDDVAMNLTKRGNKLYVDIIPDRTWLDDPERVYPVVIDPTIAKYQAHAEGIDTVIRGYYPTAMGGNDKLLPAGMEKVSTQNNVIRSLMKFDMSFVPQSAHILNANLSMWLGSVSNDTPVNISVHEMTKSWAENATWNVRDGVNAWTTKGGDFVSTPASTYSGVSYLTDLSIHYNWDVTNLATKWRSTANFGLVLKSASESTATLKSFVSSDSITSPNYVPMLTVTYYPASRLGVENYWTFEPHAVVGGQISANMTTGMS